MGRADGLALFTTTRLAYAEQNYHSVFGEIDGIFIQAEQLIFVEVKARSQTGYGKAYEVVSASKQRKIMKTAMQFLTEYPHYSEILLSF